MSYFEQTKLTDNTGSVINPATDEGVMLLRRLVKLLESNATVDYANRQKIIVEGMPTTNVTLTSNAVSVGNIVSNGGVDPRYEFIDMARIAYGTNIRNNLIFS